MKNNSFDLSTADGRVRQWLFACLEGINHENSAEECQVIGELADALKITYAELNAFLDSIQIGDDSEADALCKEDKPRCP